MFYKLRDKERSNESAYVFNLFFRTPLKSAYVLVGFLARPFAGFVSHIARHAPFTTDKSSSLSNPAQLNFRTPLEPFFCQHAFQFFSAESQVEDAVFGDGDGARFFRDDDGNAVGFL